MDAAVIKKLRFKPGIRCLMLNAPVSHSGALTALAADPEPQETSGGSYDFVLIFCRNRSELDHWLGTAKHQIRYDGLLWLCYPKGSSGVPTDLNRDILWALLRDQGLEAVSQVAIDDIWSAMRFRPSERVGK